MRRRSVRWLAAVAAVVVVLGVVVLVLQHVHSTVLPWNRSQLTAAAYLPGWDDASAASLDTAVRSGVTEVSPVWATVAPDGALTRSAVPAAETDALERHGVQVIPTVQNYANGQWQGTLVSDLLSDPARRERHVAAIVDATVSGGWAGVDIDYEQLPPLAGPAFTTFLRELADQLHGHGMVLSVAVPARTSDEGDSNTFAYPYRLLGTIVDEVRIMAYDYSYPTGSAGPIAPLPWVKAVVEYTVARVPKEKVMLGLATYGYDWGGRSGTDIGGAAAAELAAANGVRPRWDRRSASWSFTYQQSGRAHTVWYEDSRSIAAKQQVALDQGLRGVAFWRLGGEDPAMWTTVAAATGGSAR